MNTYLVYLENTEYPMDINDITVWSSEEAAADFIKEEMARYLPEHDGTENSDEFYRAIDTGRISEAVDYFNEWHRDSGNAEHVMHVAWRECK